DAAVHDAPVPVADDLHGDLGHGRIVGGRDLEPAQFVDQLNTGHRSAARARDAPQLRGILEGVDQARLDQAGQVVGPLPSPDERTRAAATLDTDLLRRALV